MPSSDNTTALAENKVLILYILDKMLITFILKKY